VDLKADLHTHSNKSDGMLAPAEVLQRFHEAGFDLLALTDHDTYAGYLEARDKAAEIGLELISGVEVSTLHQGVDVHILAYGFEPNEDFSGMLDEIQDERIIRAEKILRNLHDLWGFELTMEMIYRIAGKRQQVGRPHIARAMVENGYVNGVQEAFDRYLGNHSPAYLPKDSYTPREVVDAVRRAGGVTVLAHPFLLESDFMMLDIIEAGVDGIEAHYIEHTEGQVRFYSTIAQKYGLIRTGGSDFHGFKPSDTDFGKYSAPAYCIGELKERIQRRRSEIQS
jgi:3',5'-nucleoside bisphosphate phosphatase